MKKAWHSGRQKVVWKRKTDNTQVDDQSCYFGGEAGEGQQDRGLHYKVLDADLDGDGDVYQFMIVW